MAPCDAVAGDGFVVAAALVVPVAVFASMPSTHLAHSVDNFHLYAPVAPSDRQTAVPLVLLNHLLVRVLICLLLCAPFLSYFRPAHLTIARAVAFRRWHSVAVLRSYLVVDGIAIAVAALDLEPVHLLWFERLCSVVVGLVRVASEAADAAVYLGVVRRLCTGI